MSNTTRYHIAYKAWPTERNLTVLGIAIDVERQCGYTVSQEELDELLDESFSRVNEYLRYWPVGTNKEQSSGYHYYQ